MSVRLVIVLAALAFAALAAPAGAAPAHDLPQMPEVCPTAAADRGDDGVVATAAAGPTVLRTVRDAARRGQISAEDGERYERIYRVARAVRARLSGARRAELAAVIAQLDAFARARQLTVSRMPALFLQLEENAKWWARHAPPRPPKPSSKPCAGGTGQGGARVVRDEIVLQWYAGQGLQIQQLATAGRANALVKACIEPDREATRRGDDARAASRRALPDAVRGPRARAAQMACDRDRVRAAMDGLAMLAVDRGGFRAWEYYFAFGGGRPPWISGLAQGTAMQALARGAQVLGEPRYLQVARSARGAFERRPPRGVRVPAGSGVHYLIYSFNPNLRVLNGFLQALVGLHDYAEAADDDTARRLFAEGERRAREEVPVADTGAWSRYSAGGSESDLGYHRLVRDFLRSMCDRTKRAVYCSTAERFTAYLREPAKLRFLAAPTARAGRPSTARFFLTKIACVTLRVSQDGRTVVTTTRVLGRGARALAWTPPRAGTYRVEVQAEDLVGHKQSIAAVVRAR